VRRRRKRRLGGHFKRTARLWGIKAPIERDGSQERRIPEVKEVGRGWTTQEGAPTSARVRLEKTLAIELL
jgi:hypothetical protein